MKIAYITHPDCLLHEADATHPEQPARIRAIENALFNSELAGQLSRYESPAATQEQLAYVHDPLYIQHIFQMSPKDSVVYLDPDTYMNQYTLPAALHAAGAVLQAVDLVMSHEVNLAFCNIRPPGHHAEHMRAMGFSFFNNVAVGVAYALKRYKLKRIAIIDFDVHHGNGTQDIFQNEKRVLYCSIFQYPFYPFSDVDAGGDHIINIALPAGTTGREFRAEIEQHWLGAVRAFKPEIIFFSAGFDGHRNDVLANWLLTEFDYAWLTRRIKQIADECAHGRMISVLEGGYALDVLGQCVVAHLGAML